MLFRSLVCAVMDARRSEVYNALFRIAEGRPVRLCEDRAVPLQILVEELAAYPDAPFLVGDGAILADKYLQECGLRSRLAPEPLQLQNAWG